LLHGRTCLAAPWVDDRVERAHHRQLHRVRARPDCRRQRGEPEAARGCDLPGALARVAGARTGARAPSADTQHRPRGALGALGPLADLSSVYIVIPAFNESASIAAVVGVLRAAGPWREIIVVDDGSSDGTGERAAAAGAMVIRHPYNKG